MLRRTVVATLLAGVVLLGACGNDDGGGAADAGPREDTREPTGEIVLQVEPAADGRCAMPSAASLQAQDTAFEGTVVDLADGIATLDVDAWFKGEEVTQVTVQAPTPDMGALLGAVDFRTGRSYLVSAVDGKVSLCGLTGEKDALLTDLYTQAYPG